VRIQLEDALDPAIEARDTTHLGDTLVRFRLVRPLDLAPGLEFVRDGRRDVDALFPSAPNRPAVQQLLDRARAAVAEGWKAQQGSALLRQAGARSERDYLAFCEDHFCRPSWLYTNGSGLVSLVERGPALEALPHGSLKDYRRFNGDYECGRPFPAAWLGARFGSRDAAETWIAARLAQLPTRSLTLVRGEERRTAFLQSAGERPGDRGYPVETYLLHGAGDVTRVRIEPGRSADVLRGLAPDGFRARCCATCAHFSFSGMSWDMSNGTAGHCAKRASDPVADQPGGGLTGTFDVCEQHALAAVLP
jgi:hypothetical protein